MDFDFSTIIIVTLTVLSIIDLGLGAYGTLFHIYPPFCFHAQPLYRHPHTATSA